MESENIEEEIPEKEKFRIEKDEKRKITMNLITRTSLDQKAVSCLSEDQKIDLIIGVKSIHLEFMNIDVIENLQVFSKVVVLFLNNNNIKKMQGLDTLISLEYLALNNNQISKIEGISNLKSLQGLNLANNRIEYVRGNEFPPGIQILSLKENPVSYEANYRQILVKNLKELQVIDGIELSTEEKFRIQGIFPTHLNKYAEKMKKIREKQQKPEETQPTFLTNTVINEQQALRQLREKTAKLLQETKQATAAFQQQQIENFNQKIKVSRKIREIVATNTRKE